MVLPRDKHSHEVSVRNNSTEESKSYREGEKEAFSCELKRAAEATRQGGRGRESHGGIAVFSHER